jgi:3-dehydroquinate dehydratase
VKSHEPTLEERVLTIEAMLPTLATKADIAEVRVDLLAVRADIARWMLRMVMAAMGAALFGVLLVALA